MSGTKAVGLEAHCRDRGRACVRFDYSGHGASGGRFEDGTIGQWASDAIDVITRVTQGPLVLVGSSMGGWIMLLAALSLAGRVRGLVGIAPAPDFTEELVLRKLPEEERRKLLSEGVVKLPNPYGPEPTPVTLRFVEEARRHLLLGSPIPIHCPVRLLHGLADPDVPWQTSLRLVDALESGDATVTLIKDAGHRLSDPPHLRRLFAAVDELCEE
jgi:pimeloyl-ACP methyl ester carboxylesterase